MAGQIKRIYENKPVKIIKKRKKASTGKGKKNCPIKTEEKEEEGDNSDSLDRVSLSDS